MIFAIKKKTVLKVATLVVVISVLCALVFSSSVAPGFAGNKKLPIYSVETQDNKVAITFDASWGADKTSQIMDIMEQHGYKATFFLVGFWVDNYPEKVKEIHERGHLIGNHSTNHLHMNSLNETRIHEEISRTGEKIEELVGYTPMFFRAPFGEYNDRLVNYCEKNNVKIIQWDVDTLDWKGLSGSEITKRVLTKSVSGSVILCHNNSEHIVSALPLMLMGLKNKGLTPVRLDELVYESDYRINQAGKQVKIA
ncbi:MAG: polysaccharide deacetylase family protein [Firmicutes bacterium]|nr:polysaccharide deacetylase family protein [Bacillota bacterium]